MNYFVLYGSAQVSSTSCEVGLWIFDSFTLETRAKDSDIIEKVLIELQLEKFNEIKANLFTRASDSKNISVDLTKDLKYTYYFQKEDCLGMRKSISENSNILKILNISIESLLLIFCLIGIFFGFCVYLMFLTENCKKVLVFCNPRKITPKN